MTKEMVQADLDALPESYRTKDVDALIRRYVKNNADVSALRGYVLTEQQFHRIYFYVTLDQIGSVNDRLKDDDHYYVQMGEAWLIAELAVDEPDKIYRWMANDGMKYNINGKAIQKICDSYRISDEWKEHFKGLRKALRTRK